jgi:hypothetical protein
MYDSTRDPHNVAEQGLTANTASVKNQGLVNLAAILETAVAVMVLS